jgi:hypothetical protein
VSRLLRLCIGVTYDVRPLITAALSGETSLPVSVIYGTGCADSDVVLGAVPILCAFDRISLQPLVRLAPSYGDPPCINNNLTSNCLLLVLSHLTTMTYSLSLVSESATYPVVTGTLLSASALCRFPSQRRNAELVYERKHVCICLQIVRY